VNAGDPGPRPAEGISHTGILVADMATEVDRFAALLGVEFQPPAVLTFAHVETAGGVERDVEVLITYSGGRPPFYELLEATGETVWRPEGIGLHHVGGYVADLAAEEARLEALGLTVEARISTAEGQHIITFFEPDSASGARVELLSEVLYPNWRAWVSGGLPPGHRHPPSA
jgi:catechol 2,3-dioxygenase-like lactoylglutathione lyase family enzyme